MPTVGPVNATTRRRLGILFSLPLAFSLLFFSLTLATEHTDVNLLRTSNLTSCVEQLDSLANDAQAGEGGFLVTGDERYLSTFEQASAMLPTQIDACSHAAEDRSKDVRHQIAETSTLVQKRFAQADLVLNVQKTKGFAAAVDAMRRDQSEVTMNDIRRQTGDLQRRFAGEQTDYLDNQRSLTRWA